MATNHSTGVDFSKCVGFKYDPVPVSLIIASTPDIEIGELE
jgi:hypothetical protein